MPNTPRLLYDAGDKRFACECGARMTEGGQAVEHALYGHEVAIEELRNGKWRYRLGGSQKDVMDMIIERMRMRGENVGEFVRRVQELAEQARIKAESRQYVERN